MSLIWCEGFGLNYGFTSKGSMIFTTYNNLYLYCILPATHTLTVHLHHLEYSKVVAVYL